MKKKILRAVLSAIVAFSLIFCLASCATSKVADADDAQGDIEGTDISWKYDADDKKLKIKGTGAIPDFDSTEDVSWYEVRHSVEKIEISDGITAIGDYSFYYCPELEDAEIPDSVTSIGKQAFAFCSSLESIELPSALSALGESCFEACTALKGIFVPSSVTSIGARAFAHCSSLEEAVIMAQLSSIEEWTFMGCKSLDSLTLNETDKNISVADDAFEDANIGFESAVYTVSLTGEATLTVKYVYEDGAEAAQPHVEQLERGSNYSVTSPDIEGYKASEAVVKGIISGDESITVTYTKLESDSETEEAADSEAESDATSDEDKEGVSVGTWIAIGIFAVVIIAIVVLAVIMLRSDKKTASSNGKNAKKK